MLSCVFSLSLFEKQKSWRGRPSTECIVTFLFFTAPCCSQHLYMNQEMYSPMLCLFLCAHVWQPCVCHGVRGKVEELVLFSFHVVSGIQPKYQSSLLAPLPILPSCQAFPHISMHLLLMIFRSLSLLTVTHKRQEQCPYNTLCL